LSPVWSLCVATLQRDLQLFGASDPVQLFACPSGHFRRPSRFQRQEMVGVMRRYGAWPNRPGRSTSSAVQYNRRNAGPRVDGQEVVDHEGDLRFAGLDVGVTSRRQL
jgi:hypothetical protein